MKLKNIERTSFLYGVVFSIAILFLLTLLIMFFFNADRKEKPLETIVYANDQTSIEDTPSSTNNLPYSTLQDTPKNSQQEDSTQSSANNSVKENNEGSEELVLSSLQQILNSSLPDYQALALSELPVQTAVEAINNDDELLTKAIDQIQLLPHSEQRAFLLRTMKQARPEVRLQASYDLLASSRVLDRKNGVGLLMTIEEKADKALLTQYLLQTENDEEVVLYALSHMSAANDKDTAIRSLDELNNLAQSSNNPQVKGLALQVIMKVDPNNQEVFEQVTTLVDSGEPTESFQGLNILHQQLNDFGKPLSEQQIQSTQEQLTELAADASLPQENRNKALSILKILAEKNGVNP